MTSLLLLHDLKILISQRTLTHNMTNNKLARELVVTIDLKKIFESALRYIHLIRWEDYFLPPRPGRKLIVPKMLRRGQVRFLNVFCTSNVRPVSLGKEKVNSKHNVTNLDFNRIFASDSFTTYKQINFTS